jgi:endonuclease YncB( thermonuclease family)
MSSTPSICPDSLDERYKKYCNAQNEYNGECVGCWKQLAIIEPQNEPQNEPPNEPRIKDDECCICKHTDKNPDEWPCKVCSNAYTNEFRRQKVE